MQVTFTLAAELACWGFLFGGAYIAWWITP